MSADFRFSVLLFYYLTYGMHRVQKTEKRCHQTQGSNLVKSQQIFKILLPLEREGNFE